MTETKKQATERGKICNKKCKRCCSREFQTYNMELESMLKEIGDVVGAKGIFKRPIDKSGLGRIQGFKNGR